MENKPISITLGREHFHKQGEMLSWLVENIGPGGWSWHTNDKVGNIKWKVESMFGYTTFEFINEADAAFFVLRWT